MTILYSEVTPSYFCRKHAAFQRPAVTRLSDKMKNMKPGLFESLILVGFIFTRIYIFQLKMKQNQPRTRCLCAFFHTTKTMENVDYICSFKVLLLFFFFSSYFSFSCCCCCCSFSCSCTCSCSCSCSCACACSCSFSFSFPCSCFCVLVLIVVLLCKREIDLSLSQQ